MVDSIIRTNEKIDLLEFASFYKDEEMWFVSSGFRKGKKITRMNKDSNRESENNPKKVSDFIASYCNIMPSVYLNSACWQEPTLVNKKNLETTHNWMDQNKMYSIPTNIYVKNAPKLPKARRNFSQETIPVHHQHCDIHSNQPRARSYSDMEVLLYFNFTCKLLSIFF